MAALSGAPLAAHTSEDHSWLDDPLTDEVIDLRLRDAELRLAHAKQRLSGLRTHVLALQKKGVLPTPDDRLKNEYKGRGAELSHVSMLRETRRPLLLCLPARTAVRCGSHTILPAAHGHGRAAPRGAQHVHPRIQHESQARSGTDVQERSRRRHARGRRRLPVCECPVCCAAAAVS